MLNNRTIQLAKWTCKMWFIPLLLSFGKNRKRSISEFHRKQGQHPSKLRITFAFSTDWCFVFAALYFNSLSFLSLLSSSFHYSFLVSYHSMGSTISIGKMQKRRKTRRDIHREREKKVSRTREIRKWNSKPSSRERIEHTACDATMMKRRNKWK